MRKKFIKIIQIYDCNNLIDSMIKTNLFVKNKFMTNNIYINSNVVLLTRYRFRFYFLLQLML